MPLDKAVAAAADIAAVEKPIESKSGVLVSHWKPYFLMIDFKSSNIQMGFEGYVDEQSFNDGKSAESNKTIVLDLADDKESIGSIISRANDLL